MERDSVISHGASHILRERMCFSSNPLRAPFCKTCGTIAVTRHGMDDLEAVNGSEYTCRSCSATTEENFGVCTIPYTNKLLTHYLTVMGIKMRFNMSSEEPQTPNVQREETNM